MKGNNKTTLKNKCIMKKYESQIAVIYYNVDGYTWCRDHQNIYEFDEEQTALLDRILPLIASGDYHLIGDIANEYVVLPF